MISNYIINHLKTVSAVTDLIGTNPVKVFPSQVPKKVGSVEIKAPYVLLNATGGDDERAMQGRTGVVEQFYAVQAVSEETLSAANQIYMAILGALDSASYDDWAGMRVHYSEMSQPTQGSVSASDGAQDALEVMVGTLFIRFDNP